MSRAGRALACACLVVSPVVACGSNRYVTAPEDGVDASAHSAARGADAIDASACMMAMLSPFGAPPECRATMDRNGIPPVDLSDAGVGMDSWGHDPRADAGPPSSRHGRLLPSVGDAAALPADASILVGHPSVLLRTHPAPSVSNVDRVVAGLRPKMRSCYARGLDLDPTQRGSLTLEATLAPNGEVVQTKVLGRSRGLGLSVAECAERVLRNGNFDPPGPGGATLTVDVDLTP